VHVGLRLDAWMIEENASRREDGGLSLKPCTIKVLGQTALLEANVPLKLKLTMDVDVYANLEWVVQVEFRRLLAMQGRQLDPVGHEIWMPSETQYNNLFVGKYVTMLVADFESVLVSKALKAPEKNRDLVAQYLSRGASPRFVAMAQRYNIDLEKFV
ncbi:MAG: hypothetical protein RL701_4519, partial [Pseudomonadota bacterium]